MEGVKITIKRMDGAVLANVYSDGIWIGVIHLLETPIPGLERAMLSRGEVVEAEIIWKGAE